MQLLPTLYNMTHSSSRYYLHHSDHSSSIDLPTIQQHLLLQSEYLKLSLEREILEVYPMNIEEEEFSTHFIVVRFIRMNLFPPPPPNIISFFLSLYI
jgi:hypothetical protein